MKSKRIGDVLENIVKSEDFPASDPTEIRRVAGSRRRRHVLEVGAVLAVFAAVGGITAVDLLPNRASEPSAAVTAVPPVSATRSTAVHLGPACDAPYALVNGQPTDGGEVLETIDPGKTDLPIVTLRSTPGVRIISAELIIAKPGSTPGVGPASSLPKTSAMLAANQVATTGIQEGSSAADGIRLAASIQDPGMYTLYYWTSYSSSPDCMTPPTEDSPRYQAMGPIGTIIVSG